MVARDPNHIKCIDCRWWEAGLCRFNPPQMVLWPTDNQMPVLYQPSAMWPDVRDDDWCGRYETADMLSRKQRAAERNGTKQAAPEGGE